MSSITGNSDNIFVNNANLKIVKPGKGIIFADGSVFSTAPPNSDSGNTAYFSNGINAFVITETTANTGFAGNTAPTDAISVSSNLFISYTGNLITFGQITAGSVANVESNILTLEVSNGLIWSNITTLQTDLSTVNSNLNTEITSNITTLQTDLSTVNSNLNTEITSNITTLQTKTTDITHSGSTTTINGNVIATSNLGIGSLKSDAPLSITGSGSNFYNFKTTRGIYMGVHNSTWSAIECVSTSGNSGWIDFKNEGSNTDFSERIRGGNGKLVFQSNSSDANNMTLSTVQSNVSLDIRALNENSDATLYLGTPFNSDSASKCAIIAEGIFNWSRSNLHFCLNNNTEAGANDLSNTASIADSKMTILSGGNVGISNTAPNYELSVNGNVYITGSYSPFTGSHISLNTLPSHEDGTLVASTGNVSTDDTVYNTFIEIEPTSVSKDKRVIGVVCNRKVEVSDGASNSEPNTYTTTTTQIIAVGEGRMLVCNENGDIENGDYICSSNVIGYGMKQDDDLLHNYTVAKATEDCSFTGPDDKKLVSVTFHCG